MVGAVTTGYQVAFPPYSTRRSFVATRPATFRIERDSSAPPQRTPPPSEGTYRAPTWTAAIGTDLVQKLNVTQTWTLATNHESARFVTTTHNTTNNCFHVNGHVFESLRELGRGSFGVVWEVQERAYFMKAPKGRPPLALK